jgi:hypothetical protein
MWATVMRKNLAAIVLLPFVVGFAGCNKGSSAEGTYKDKSESEWLKLCDDGDPEKRKEAWEAMQYFFDDRAKAKVDATVRSGNDPIALNAAAQHVAPERPEDAVAALKRSLKQGGGSQVTDPHFRAAVRRLGPGAKALIPDLEGALASEKTPSVKTAVQGMINVIPK